jgi:hypothetical protein
MNGGAISNRHQIDSSAKKEFEKLNSMIVYVCVCVREREREIVNETMKNHFLKIVLEIFQKIK